ncbi:hypothetical protein B0H19DRAFT_85425 [Mycena capillaripes]|nr:hypothetical protein B0H19DRAFT_85425 [Mycena capillaripes]
MLPRALRLQRRGAERLRIVGALRAAHTLTHLVRFGVLVLDCGSEYPTSPALPLRTQSLSAVDVIITRSCLKFGQRGLCLPFHSRVPSSSFSGKRRFTELFLDLWVNVEYSAALGFASSSSRSRLMLFYSTFANVSRWASTCQDSELCYCCLLLSLAFRPSIILLCLVAAMAARCTDGSSPAVSSPSFIIPISWQDLTLHLLGLFLAGETQSTVLGNDTG